MMRRSVVLALIVGLSAFAPACHRGEARSPYEAMSQLSSPEWKDRRRAADDLARDGGPPPVAVPALYQAIMHEPNPKAYGAMLITLGASGIAEARPLIDARVNDPDLDMQRWARRALKKWLVRNMLWSDDQDLPPPPNPVYGPPAALPPGAPAGTPTPGLNGPPVAPQQPSGLPPPPPPPPGVSI